MQPTSNHNTTEIENNAIEKRLDAMTRELKRQKIMTLALFIGAIVAVSATKVISQNQTNTLAVTTLQIVDSKGRVKAFISADPIVNKTGATLAFLDENGKKRATISTDARNSMVSFSGSGANKEPMAMLGYCDNAGVLTLSNQDSKNGATIVTGKDVAGVVVTGPSGKEAFSLEVDKSGSDMKLMDADGNLKR